MNQYEQTDLPPLKSISWEEAIRLIQAEFGKEIKLYTLLYYSWPQYFSNTAGPFSRHGKLVGQAFTWFQMECWTDGQYCVVFSRGQVVKVYKSDEPFTVDGYLNTRSNYS